MTSQVVIALGANLGNVELIMDTALAEINSRIGPTELLSSRYVTKAWGVEDQPDYLNQVVVVQSHFSPQELLKTCLSIEKKLGRIRIQGERWSSRTIDLDILFYADEMVNEADLIIPHQHLHERNFILHPLKEILPDFIHPVFNMSVSELYDTCSDPLEVKKI